MALSQIQCLDNQHVNWRMNESKPEFFYSEDQRVAVEALISKGRDAFRDYIAENGVRDFLSEPELERITQRAEVYRPGHEHLQKTDTPGPGNTTPGYFDDGADGNVSLQYWPDRSEASVAELDLGWPDSISYRGVTRVTVYTQPPPYMGTHIKEVVRKSIAAAQKVIAVVMDVFTDVDIFRDLMDAAYKRRVPVYIIIDIAAVPCFLSMCGRADMHRGHLKNLRVRCCGGVEFFTRSAQKVRGSLSQRFLLVDGDRAISGSYSFTWSSSRLDCNLITVITGQAVETFDLQFRDLYLTSRSVSLSKVPMVDEPVPDPLPQAAPAILSTTIAKKLINPKYALVASGNHTPSPSSSDQNSSNKNPQNPTGLKMIKARLRNVIEEPSIHPALANMEKANLIPYLPTWPEPDPPSDVIGFINIMDEKRANKVHLQRSERFEVSQAIRFSSPLLIPAKEEPAAAVEESPLAGAAEKPSADAEAGTPGSPTKKQLQQQADAAVNEDQHEATDSNEPPQQTDTPVATDAQELNGHTQPAQPSDVPADSQPTDKAEEIPESAPQTAPPPVPKPRTLHLILEPTSSEQPDQPQVTLMKMDQLENVDDLSEHRSQEELRPARALALSKLNARDSGSNDEGSQDSTKVICDRAANEDPSSASTASDEEFFDCSQPEPPDPLTNGATTGSGRGHRLGDGVNMMARISQSMLDLRQVDQPEPPKLNRRQAHPSPHRHIGQLFQTSRSPVRNSHQRRVKPGSFLPAAHASSAAMGAYRYSDGQMLPVELAPLRAETRSGRSPQRQNYRNIDQAPLPANPSGLLGVSFSKLNNLRHLRARVGASQKKSTQNKSAK
ncbi:protein FAM83G-like [Antennarius striatus]|uniref:protein FAM83G-like n=1 Tax=Antennarius striatus TaxID=241820 RepID=UPI0035B41571